MGIAAVVVGSKYGEMAATDHGGGGAGSAGFDEGSLEESRILHLEVAWCTVSSKDAEKKHKVRAGSRIFRKEKAIFRFETFRAPWEQEDRRWTAQEELGHTKHFFSAGRG